MNRNFHSQRIEFYGVFFGRVDDDKMFVLFFGPSIGLKGTEPTARNYSIIHCLGIRLAFFSTCRPQ